MKIYCSSQYDIDLTPYAGKDVWVHVKYPAGHFGVLHSAYIKVLDVDEDDGFVKGILVPDFFSTGAKLNHSWADIERMLGNPKYHDLFAFEGDKPVKTMSDVEFKDRLKEVLEPRRNLADQRFLDKYIGKDVWVRITSNDNGIPGFNESYIRILSEADNGNSYTVNEIDAKRVDYAHKWGHNPEFLARVMSGVRIIPKLTCFLVHPVEYLSTDELIDIIDNDAGLLEGM